MGTLREGALGADGRGIDIGGSISVGGGGKGAGDGNGGGMARGEDARDVIVVNTTGCIGDHWGKRVVSIVGDGGDGMHGVVNVGEEAEGRRRVEHEAGLNGVRRIRDSRIRRRRTWFIVTG